MNHVKFEDLIETYQNRISTLIANKQYWGAGDKEITKDNLSWVNTHSEQLVNYIESKYDKLSTKKGYLATINKVLSNSKRKSNKLKLKIVTITNQVNILNQKLYDKELDNALDENEQENYQSYNEIVALREELLAEWKKDKFNNTNNIKYLILCLNTLAPPLRSEYIKMPIVEQEPTGEKSNALIKTESGYDFYVDKDKVSKRHKALRYALDEELVEIINKSLKYYPRPFLLSPPIRNRSKAMSYNTYNDLLVSMGLSICNFRSAYITHAYNHDNLTLRMKNDLALKMRHGLETQMVYYNKILPDE